MDRIIENLKDYIDRKLNGFGAVDRINIILDLREHLDTFEREAMIEEYQLEDDYFE